MKKLGFLAILAILFGGIGVAEAESDWSGAFVTTTIDRIVCAAVEGQDCPDEVIIQKKIVLPGVNDTDSRTVNVKLKQIEPGASGSISPKSGESNRFVVTLPKKSGTEDSDSNAIAEIQRKIAEEKNPAAIEALQRKLNDFMVGSKNSGNLEKDPAQQKKWEEQYAAEREKKAAEDKQAFENSKKGRIYKVMPDGTQLEILPDGTERQVINTAKEKKGFFDFITNPAKPAPDWKKIDAEKEAERVKKDEEYRQAVENSKNSSVYEVMPDGTTRLVSEPPQEKKRDFFDILKGNPEKIREQAVKALEALPAETQVRIEEMKKEFEAKREEAKTAFEVQKEALKEKISTISDEKKQEIVSRLSENINELNKKKTEDFSGLIVKLERVWASIEAKAGQAAGQGMDTNFVTAADSQIEVLFSAAKNALNDQAGQIYELTVTTENNLKTDINQVRQELHSDLKSVQEKIGAVKDLLRQTASQLNQVLESASTASSAPATAE